MVNVRNIKGNYALFHVLFWKSFCYLTPLNVFHNHNKLCPGNLFFCNRHFIVKPSRSALKSVFENMLSCFASVLILVADKQYFHNIKKKLLTFIKFFLNQNILNVLLKLMLSFVLLSSGVFAVAVTPSYIDFSSSGKARLVVFNTEDYIKDFSLDLQGSGFSIDQSTLRIPPRSSMPVNLSSHCSDCGASLYIRELSDSQGIKIEPAVVVKLSSALSSGSHDDLEVFDPEENKITSFSVLGIKKQSLYVFIAIISILVCFPLIFLLRKLYKNKYHRKLNIRKKKWLRK